MEKSSPTKSGIKHCMTFLELEERCSLTPKARQKPSRTTKHAIFEMAGRSNAPQTCIPSDSFIHALSFQCTTRAALPPAGEPNKPTDLQPQPHTFQSMPLTTIHYTCPHTRQIQGRECSCFYNQMLKINDPRHFNSPWLPFDRLRGCRHDRTIYRPYACSECRERRERELERLYFLERFGGGRRGSMGRRRHGEGFGGGGGGGGIWVDRWRNGPWWYPRDGRERRNSMMHACMTESSSRRRMDLVATAKSKMRQGLCERWYDEVGQLICMYIYRDDGFEVPMGVVQLVCFPIYLENHDKSKDNHAATHSFPYNDTKVLGDFGPRVSNLMSLSLCPPGQCVMIQYLLPR
ncbi:uncharacterized protein MYCFIDRAFT_174547 [Pseudocercospora fijiensis CIRAD86]|uniref:Uncharacterized protein n=1 Tax=Pseudocercospora fijiensis (strain CIRAD86) TaxID=383855 RepID=M2YZL3_PSEFD|nr:uncharacterized protein MYCFIDRAFT_174547 [Pseudocercospora fijiensis CIRAD86]EME83065.1 hypothetical protein MYCFIDRAFT_174547 [Pseudocercospora fijiensis CIRAD86]